MRLATIDLIRSQESVAVQVTTPISKSKTYCGEATINRAKATWWASTIRTLVGEVRTLWPLISITNYKWVVRVITHTLKSRA